MNTTKVGTLTVLVTLEFVDELQFKILQTLFTTEESSVEAPSSTVRDTIDNRLSCCQTERLLTECAVESAPVKFFLGRGRSTIAMRVSGIPQFAIIRIYLYK